MSTADRPYIPEEWKSWRHWIDEARVNDNLSQLDRDATAAGLEHLRRLFGDQWFAAAAEQLHPLFITLLNASPISQVGVASLGHELTALERSTSIKHLVGRMKHRQQFQGAVAEIEIAAKARRAGFVVELPRAMSSRVADIRIIDPPVHIEVTALDTSDSQNDVERTSLAIADAMMGHEVDGDVVGGGRIFDVMSDTLIKECRRKIRSRMAQVKRTGRPASMRDEHVDLRFALRTDTQSIAAMQAEGYAGLAGPTLFANELNRLCRALQGKVRRFPDVPDGSGIVLVWDSWAPVEVRDEVAAQHFAKIIERNPRVAVATLLYPSMTVGRGRHGHAPVVDRRNDAVILHDVGWPAQEVVIVQRRRMTLSETDLFRFLAGVKPGEPLS